MKTPWGKADSAEKIAEGITFYSTPSHGGVKLSPERLASMPAMLREIKPFAGPGWYEEDCDYSLVVLAFPECFEPAAVKRAVEFARGCTWWTHHVVASLWLNTPEAIKTMARADEADAHEAMLAWIEGGGSIGKT